MQYPGVQNQIDQPIYDTVEVTAATAGTYSLFVAPLNSPIGAAVKGYQHTNLVQAGRLEAGWEFMVKGMTMNIKDFNAAGARYTLVDYLVVMAGHINFQIGQVSVLRMPVIQIPPGPGELNYFSNIVAAATEYKTSHGIIAFQNRFHFKNPLVIQEQEGIQVDLTVAAPAAAIQVMCVLWGTLTRPVR
jgi:hypothetical protein